MQPENDDASTNTPDPEAGTGTEGAQAETAGAGNDAGTASPIEEAVNKALTEDDDHPDADDSEGDEGADDEGQDGDAGKPKDGEADDDHPGDEDAGEDGADPDLVPPEGIGDKARERFNTLVERVKESEDRATQAETNFQQIESTLKSTGASPDDWGKIIVALQYANSGDPAQARHALEILDGFRANVARIAGVPVQGVDVLADFPDLRTKVENGDLDEADAAEIAALRRSTSTRREQDASRQNERQAQEQVVQRQTAARGELDKLGAQLAKADVDFKAKVKILEDRGVIANIVKNVPPEAWCESFQTAYDAVNAATAGMRTRAPTPGEQPMRRNGRNGGGAEGEPKTVADAVRKAVAEG